MQYPSAKWQFPSKVAKMLGFTNEQIKPGLVVPRLGKYVFGFLHDGLAATLDIAKPVTDIHDAFGSGAGSDAFSFSVTDKIDEIRNGAPALKSCWRILFI